jgi:hypothetical protein
VYAIDDYYQVKPSFLLYANGTKQQVGAKDKAPINATIGQVARGDAEKHSLSLAFTFQARKP